MEVVEALAYRGRRAEAGGDVSPIKLTTVYHWSPSTFKESISRDGLKILIGPGEEYENPNTGGIETWRAPYICTSLDPWTALCFTFPQFSDDPPSLDLYEIKLRAADRVKIRNDFGVEIIEIRIENSIPSGRVTYIATREC